MNQNTEYKDWDKTLCYLVDNGCFDDARKIAYTYIKQYQADETFVILFILFQISDAEKSSGEYNIFSSPASGTTEALIKHYTQIKFCLRRYEYDMPEEALEEAFGYFIENKVSVNVLIQHMYINASHKLSETKAWMHRQMYLKIFNERHGQTI